MSKPLGTSLTLDQLRLVHAEVAERQWANAANLILFAIGLSPDCDNAADGEKLVRLLFEEMMDCGNTAGAAALCFPRTVFCPDSESVTRLFKSAEEKDMLLSMGASSMGKSYNLVVFNYLQWLRDPLWTAVKLMSQTEGHLRTNIWPHLLEIHQQNVLKPLRKVAVRDADLWMGIENHPMSYGFNGMAFKQSSISAGAWKGFKPQPKRPKEDPSFEKFGPMTRLRVLMDEAQQIPEAVWTDLNSVLASVGGKRVKVMAAFNPENLSQSAVQRAEPPEGWMPDQLDSLYSYESKYGWWVERLDGKRCENVVERKEIYPGLMTYERYVGYLKGNGDNSPTYYCFARGFPPLQEAANVVIVPAWVSSQRGEAIYIGEVVNVGAFDAAYQGQDKAVLVTGRWGLASGWRDATGKHHPFVDRLNPANKRPRHVLTVDQFFDMPKSLDPIGLNQQLMGQCKQLGIEPQWLSMDKTGNALATYSYVSKYFGNVLGIGWNEASTESRILVDDIDTCHNRFEGMPSEMWFALKHWLDPVVNAVVINPTVNAPELYTQLTSRRFRYSKGNRLKIESKEEYKARNAGRSPDQADALVMMVQLLRIRSGVIPGIMEQKSNLNSPVKTYKPIAGTAEKQDDTMDFGGKDMRGGLESPESDASHEDSGLTTEDARS